MKPEPRMYSEEECETAIALFSALDEYSLATWTVQDVAHPNVPCEISARNARENLGAAECRRACTLLSVKAEATWQLIPLDERDGMTWDWEWCPEFIVFCVNWHDWHETVTADPADLLALWRAGKARAAAYEAETR